jgi:type IV secretory pathway VirB4 component
MLSALACAYLGIPESRIAWLDLGYSSFVIAHLLGAEHHDLGVPNSQPLCPLVFLDQPNGIEWLSGWFERLFARWDLKLRERAFEDFTDALRKAQREGVRTLSELRSFIYGGDEDRERIRRILQHYISYWGHLFNGKPPADSKPRVIIYETQNLMGLGINKQASAPAIELILQNILSNLDGKPSWIFADEFWNLIGDDISAPWLFTAIRSFRRLNSGFVGCSQSTVEIAASPYCNLLLESMLGKVFLPNYEVRNAYVREAYYKLGLNPHETTIISNASHRRAPLHPRARRGRSGDMRAHRIHRRATGTTGPQRI